MPDEDTTDAVRSAAPMPAPALRIGQHRRGTFTLRDASVGILQRGRLPSKRVEREFALGHTVKERGPFLKGVCEGRALRVFAVAHENFVC